MSKQELELAKEITKQLPIKDAYDDIAKPALKSTGELVGLLPRAINAALEPLHKWIFQKEYNLEQTKKLLESKLKNVKEEDIVPPEAYIAVPAIQAISYSMDNDELRNMYANLLASSMVVASKEYVHPSFVEIIKQISPDEAKIMNYLNKVKSAPVIWLHSRKREGSETIVILRNFSVLGERAGCELPQMTPAYIDNLARLKLIDLFDDAYFSDSNRYNELIEHPEIKEAQLVPLEEGRVYDILKGYLTISVFGELFCNICIGNR